MNGELITAARVSEMTTVTVGGLANWRHLTRKTGVQHGPASFKLRGRVVYRESVVLAWIAEQEAAARIEATA